MHRVDGNLYVGDELDWENAVKGANGAPKAGWSVVHACKEPYHRHAVGYTGRALNKDHPKYLIAMISLKELALNMVDAPSGKFFSRALIDPALNFIENSIMRLDSKVLVHCNKGQSRAPMIAMLYMAPQLPEKFEHALSKFEKLYPPLQFGNGCLEYLRENWDHYHGGGKDD